MPSSTQVRFIDRVQFADGQRLLASDLQALEEYQREMRWLHNRSLHQPGVASGFAVRGEKGAPALVIEPGYAIDALGRELVLAEPHTEPVPPVAGDGAGNPVLFDLTVSYSATLPESERRSAPCSNATHAVRLQELPVFCWVRVGSPDAASLRRQIESGERILLARVEVLNCQLHQRVSIAQRRNAKPSLHPYVFAACSEVTWEIENDQVGVHGIRVRAAGGVSTKAAGFRTAPHYFASLRDAHKIEIERDGSRETVLIETFAEISNPQPERFDFSVLIPRFLFNGTNTSIEEVRTAIDERIQDEEKGLAWRIEWFGVEG
ncbi:hypothetical protein [Sorangium sp. So ce341]|uniref:hypothetical protein n=1 Tax=Sorangium sp. So ce341 TaxID=3133302 RepID=UPI003F631190